MKRLPIRTSISCAALGLMSGAVALAQQGGGNRPPGGGETTAASNVSFPVIFSDNVSPTGYPLAGPWKFASITDPATQCVGEAGVQAGTAVTQPCYYGRHVTVNTETGQLSFDGTATVWWLQKNAQNFWQALSIGRTLDTKLAVSAVDVGDLLESSPTMSTRQIRTEFRLMQSVAAGDTEFGKYVVTDWTNPFPSGCTQPTLAGENDGCFAAFAMSGPVPGTQQSGTEVQGTNYPDYGNPTQRLLTDPTQVVTATDSNGVSIPIQALVYSRCARLVIQKIDPKEATTWNPATGQWSGTGVGTPVVNVAAYNDTYSAEINSGGQLVYGYNWNAKSVATGTYRLTFVLDGNDSQGPRCSTPLLTAFDAATTQLVNVGENNKPQIVYAGSATLNGGDEGGLVYLDLTLLPKGGGSRGGGGKGGN